MAKYTMLSLWAQCPRSLTRKDENRTMHMQLDDSEVKPMGQPTVSVIVPVWNGEKVIEACLNSVTGQSFHDMEIIVVNDGSTDGTGEVLRRLAARDSRIRVITQRNAGVSAARNAGMMACGGKYIRFVDADDTLPPGSMAHLVERMESTGSDLALAAYNEIVGPAHRVRRLVKDERAMDVDDMLPSLNRYANSFFYGVLWNKLFRRDIIVGEGVRFIGGLNWGEDFAFVCAYLAHARRVVYSLQAVYDYRRNPGGMTARQVLDSVLHPVRNCRMKYFLYQRLKELFVARGVYPAYRKTLWLYLLRVTINN